eukprot:1656722-Pyramimonas_sp.AAC.1
MAPLWVSLLLWLAPGHDAVGVRRRLELAAESAGGDPPEEVAEGRRPRGGVRQRLLAHAASASSSGVPHAADR